MKQKKLLVFSLSLIFLTSSCTVNNEWKEVDRAIKTKLNEYPLPERITTGLSLTKISRNKNSVIYTYEFDETIYDFEAMREYFIYDELQKAISSDAKTNYFISFLKKKGMDIEYKYIGNTSLKSFDFKFRKGEY